MTAPTVAREFLGIHLPQEIKAICDLKTLEIEPTSYIDDELKVHCSDITYKIQLKANSNSNFLYVYVLIEHQNKPVLLMPFRILKYQVAKINAKL